MRKSREHQLPLQPLWGDHRLAQELQQISQILDDNPKICDLVVQQASDKDPNKGAPGLSGEQILRCAIAKQMLQLSYHRLAFLLQDSLTLRRFCRLPLDRVPSKSCLQQNISAVDEATWRRVNRLLVGWARHEGLERGDKIRADSTPVACAVKHPLDNNLLYDAIRVVTRLLRRLREQGQEVVFSDHRRRAKRRCINIRNSRGQKRWGHYRDLLKVAHKTYGYGRRAQQQCRACAAPLAEALAECLAHYLDLMEKVIEQTERRVLRGESVPADQKVVSLFEEHTDILRKSKRETVFGHKVFLTVGRTSLVLDCVVRRGNPADQQEFQPLLQRHQRHFGSFPRQTAFDGGFASRDNLRWAQKQGVRDVAFAKKCGLKIRQMTRSRWVYRQLRRFQAGVEGCISMLKRVFGLFLCNWKGWEHFQSYVHLSVFSHNLLSSGGVSLPDNDSLP